MNLDSIFGDKFLHQKPESLDFSNSTKEDDFMRINGDSL